MEYLVGFLAEILVPLGTVDRSVPSLDNEAEFLPLLHIRMYIFFCQFWWNLFRKKHYHESKMLRFFWFCWTVQLLGAGI